MGGVPDRTRAQECGFTERSHALDAAATLWVGVAQAPRVPSRATSVTSHCTDWVDPVQRSVEKNGTAGPSSRFPTR
jgi:hypothetical protein